MSATLQCHVMYTDPSSEKVKNGTPDCAVMNHTQYNQISKFDVARVESCLLRQMALTLVEFHTLAVIDNKKWMSFTIDYLTFTMMIFF